MFTSLKLQNFKIGESRTFAFDGRVSVLEGGAGASRSIALDAFRLLFMASRDPDTAAFPRSWIASGSTTRLTVSVSTFDFPEITYDVSMRRVDGRARIIDERVSCSGRVVLSRSGGYYRAGARTRDRRRIGDDRLAIADAVRYLPDDDPVRDVRNALRDVWLVAPDAAAMDGGLDGADASSAGAEFRHLASCVSLRTCASEAVRLSMLASLRKIRDAGITGFSAMPGEDGKPVLYVRHRNDLDPCGVPFGSLDNGEKMLFLAAFVCAVNDCASPVSVVWDSPSNWLGMRTGAEVVKMLRRSFSLRGQLVMID